MAKEPKSDMGWMWKVLSTLGCLAMLVGIGVQEKATSLPLYALVLAAVPSLAPLAPVGWLPMARHLAMSAASINGALLAFLASLAFGAAASLKIDVPEADNRWITMVLVAAVISAIGSAVVVYRSQLADAHERWEDRRAVVVIESSSRVSACTRRPRVSRAAWVAVVMLAVLSRRRGRR